MAGAFASVLLHGGIEAFSDEGHGPRVDVTTLVAGTPLATEHTVVTELGTEPYGNPYLSTEGSDDTNIGPGAQEAKQDLSFTGAAYARAFDTDPRAGELNTESIQSVIDTVTSMQKEGYAVTLRVGGSASAEDESTAVDGGIQAPSQKNADLAAFRLNAFLDQVTPLLPEGVIVERLPSFEDTLSDAQAESLAAMAEQFGYEDTHALIEHWNTDPNATPPVADETLEELLGNKRGITGEIIGIRQLAESEEVITTSETVCIQPVLTLIEERTTVEPFDATIPYVVPIVAGSMVLGAAAHTIAGVSRRRQRQLEGRLLAARVASTRGGAGRAGGGSVKEPEPDSEPIPPTTPKESEPVEPTEPPTPPSPPTEKERRRWPWLIPIPLIFAAGSYTLHSCLSESQPRQQEVPAPDYCGGLEPQEVIVGEKVIEVRNGYRGRPKITLREDR